MAAVALPHDSAGDEGSVRVEVLRVGADGAVAVQDRVAEEVPVALVYNGISHAVMMTTPGDLEDFALGFSLSEGIVASTSEVHDIEVAGPGGGTGSPAEGISVDITIASERFAGLKERRRNLTGRTGCGLCGTESLAEAIRCPAPVSDALEVTPEAVARAFAALPEWQPVNRATGAVHAAGFATADGRLLLVREDVGRHNALDKLIGALARARTPFAQGFVVMTSRASYELIQKAATMGIPMLAAISAPTALAIRLAQSTGLTLAGFARGRQFVIYANPRRVALPEVVR